MGDFRKESSQENKYNFCTNFFCDINKANSENIDILKSGDKDEIFNHFPNLQSYLIDGFKDLVEKNVGKKIIVVLPPTKKTKPNQMRWLADFLKQNFNISFIEITSDEYELHSKKTFHERHAILSKAYQSWKIIDSNMIQEIKKLNIEEILYIFIDDIFTAGLTGFFVAKKINEIIKNIHCAENPDKSKWSKNFKFLCLTKLNNNLL